MAAVTGPRAAFQRRWSMTPGRTGDLIELAEKQAVDEGLVVIQVVDVSDVHDRGEVVTYVTLDVYRREASDG